MALINCIECGKQISDRAITCPHCGAPVDHKILEQKKLEQKREEEITEQDEREERERIKRIKAEQKRQEEPLGNSTSIMIGWILGILLILTAIGSLIDRNIATSLIYLMGALFLLPPIRKKVYQKTQVNIPPAYRVGIVIGVMIFAMIASSSAEVSRAEEVKQKAEEVQKNIDFEKKAKEQNKFNSHKAELLKQVKNDIDNKTYEHALPTCNAYMKLEDKDLTPLCQQVKDAIERKALAAQKIIDEKQSEERWKAAEKEAKKQESVLRATMGAKAWKVHKKHPSWSTEECKNVSEGRYWIGMSTDMMVASLGRPNSAKPSNYGNGQQWQYCYTDGWFQCFYDQNDDGIIDSYN